MLINSSSEYWSTRAGCTQSLYPFSTIPLQYSNPSCNASTVFPSLSCLVFQTITRIISTVSFEHGVILLRGIGLTTSIIAAYLTLSFLGRIKSDI